MDSLHLDDLPERVIKAFSTESFARSFLEDGKFRIGALKTFKTIEDEGRKDASEGDAQFQFPDTITKIHFIKDSNETFVTEEPGLMTTNSNLGNPVFVFCTSLTSVDVEFIKERFGDFLVEILDPKQFALDLQCALELTKLPIIGNIKGAPVEYTKGTILQGDLDTSASARLSYVQKPPQFAPEVEYRFISIFGSTLRYEDLPEFIEIDFDRPIAYARLFDDKA